MPIPALAPEERPLGDEDGGEVPCESAGEAVGVEVAVVEGSWGVLAMFRGSIHMTYGYGGELLVVDGGDGIEGEVLAGKGETG
jgi:hypothetical protein